MRALVKVIFLTLTIGSAHADDIVMDKDIYEWPEEFTYRVLIDNAEDNSRWMHSASFTPKYDPGKTTFTSVNFSNTSSGLKSEAEYSIASRDMLTTVASDPFRKYRELVLLEWLGSDDTLVASHKFFVFRELAAIPGDAISWTFVDGAVLFPGTESLRPLIGKSLPENTGTAHQTPQVDIIRLGRYMPGGAVETDYQDPPFVRQMLPVIMVQPGDEQRIPLYAADHVGHPSNARLGDQLRPRDPLQVGHYEVRVLGLGGTIMAQRRFSVRHPPLDDALSLQPAAADGYDEPPNILVSVPEAVRNSPSANVLDLKVQRVLGKEAYEYVGESRGGTIADFPSSDSGKPSTVVPLRRPWLPGTYRAILHWRDGALADEIRFEVKQSSTKHPDLPIKLEPPLEPGDVVVELREDNVQVRGPHIAFDVFQSSNRRPLETGPLIAEVYRLGYFGYDCQWFEGYYTGGSALVSRNGFGQLPSPMETGNYELRIFRPMTRFPHAGANEEIHGVQFASSGSTVTGGNMELIGAVGFEVRAFRDDELIDIEAFDPGDLGRELNITIRPPGPMLHGHALRLEAWRGAERVPGGFERAQQIRTNSRSGFSDRNLGIAIDDGRRGTQSVDIDRYPFTVKLLPIVTPGNYELRILDQTTGLYVSRKLIAMRYPGPPELPERAAYGTGITGDWPAEDDPRRGITAWYKPRSECADPEFDQPPKLEIVELLANDPDDTDDDEFRMTTDIRAGHPYFVQATFDEAPPDDEYLVRVDGERRIAVYRSFDDPRVYRSTVLNFSERVDE